MKHGFFADFKQYLLTTHKKELKTFIPYYETLLQNKDAISDLLSDYDKYHLGIEYEEDRTEGYSSGTFKFHFYEKPLSEDYGWQSHIGRCYKMSLEDDDRPWGYCECTPDDEGYVEEYHCCGDGCDWTAPQVRIEKVSNVLYKSFSGQEKDMWKLMDNWSDDLEEQKEKEKNSRLRYIDEQIKELKRQRELWLDK